jgi:hypothetical protein
LAPQHAQTASSILANVGENSAPKFLEFLQMRAGDSYSLSCLIFKTEDVMTGPFLLPGDILARRSAFEDLHHGRRTSIPPFFIFTKGETGRDVVFRALEQVKTAYIAERASPGVRIGKIFTVCADLKAERWPFAPSSFSAIVCIHFAMIDLVPCLLSSLFTARGRHVYVETFGGQGENFRVLPKAGQLRDLFSRHVEFKYYKERQVGPTEFNSVSVTLFAQKQYERGRRLRQSFQDVVDR